MSDCTHYEHCQKHFEVLHEKLDRLDEAIRGNSRPSLVVRLDRLEQDARRQGKLIWLILGAVATGLTSGVVMWMAG